jgi:hypothetical protein
MICRAQMAGLNAARKSPRRVNSGKQLSGVICQIFWRPNMSRSTQKCGDRPFLYAGFSHEINNYSTHRRDGNIE